MRAACPTEEQLAAWLDHGLPAIERDTVEAHLADCDGCRELVVEIDRSRDAEGTRIERSWRGLTRFVHRLFGRAA